MFWGGFFIGLIIGGVCGVLIVALCVANKK
jgi:hypothetical protein